MPDDESPLEGIRTPVDEREDGAEPAAADPASADSADGEPAFDIPVRPTRRYPSGGGLTYEGGTVFTLAPDPPRGEASLVGMIEDVLAGEAYRYGDWIDLPMPLYLVHDDGTDDTFRVTVRDGTIQFHVLPETKPTGLRALYERLDRVSDCTWTVDRDVSARRGPAEP